VTNLYSHSLLGEKPPTAPQQAGEAFANTSAAALLLLLSTMSTPGHVAGVLSLLPLLVMPSALDAVGTMVPTELLLGGLMQPLGKHCIDSSANGVTVKGWQAGA